MARLARGEAAQPGSPKPGTPSWDARQWPADNGLLFDDFGISPDQWAREPPATAYAGKRFNRAARVWESAGERLADHGL